MKKLIIKNIVAELKALNASASVTEIIINNVQLYNDLVHSYQTEGKSTHNAYLMYQLNGMILKQLTELKKLSKKSGDDKEDEFTKMVNMIKPPKVETR